MSIVKQQNIHKKPDILTFDQKGLYPLLPPLLPEKIIIGYLPLPPLLWNFRPGLRFF